MPVPRCMSLYQIVLIIHHFSHTDLRTSIGPVQCIITSLFGPDPLPSSSAGNWKLNFSTSLLQGFTDWKLNFSTSLLQGFTAEPGQNSQRQVSMFLILLFKLLTQFPFVSFLSISILSLLPFLNSRSSPSPPSLLSLLINSLSS